MNSILVILAIILILLVVSIIFKFVLKKQKKLKNNSNTKEKHQNQQKEDIIKKAINKNIKLTENLIQDIKDATKERIQEHEIYKAQENIDLNSKLAKANKLYEQKKYNQALEQYLNIFNLSPDNEIVLERLALTYIKLNNYNQALQILKKLYNISSDIKICKYIANIYNKTKDYDKAIIYYKKMLTYDENNIYALLKIANIYEKLKQNANALEFYQKAYQIDSDNIDVLFYLSRIYLKINKFKDSLNLLKILINKFEKSIILKENQQKLYINILNNIAYVNLKLNNKNEAVKYYKNLLKIDPKNNQALKIIKKLNNKKG